MSSKRILNDVLSFFCPSVQNFTVQRLAGGRISIASIRANCLGHCIIISDNRKPQHWKVVARPASDSRRVLTAITSCFACHFFHVSVLSDHSKKAPRDGSVVRLHVNAVYFLPNLAGYLTYPGSPPPREQALMYHNAAYGTVLGVARTHAVREFAVLLKTA